MTSPVIYLAIFCILSLTITSFSLSTPDVHDLLPKYNLPKGLIPNNVKSYTLEDDGVFTLQLKAPCYVQFDDQLVYYAKHIKGKLSYGVVSDVYGIQAKKLFLWVPVTGMKVVGDMVLFYVGALSQKLPADMFQDVPKCMKKGGCVKAKHQESHQSI